MDGHRHEGLSDEALEREIEAALGVDPSPEFLPRVRARVASERTRDGGLSSASWRWAGALAVVMAVAVIGVWTLRDPVPAPREARITAAPPEPGLGTRDSGFKNGAVARPEPPVETRRRESPPVVRAANSEPRPPVAAQFEVVISQEEAAALRQLFTAIGNRRIETSALPDLQSALKPPDPIEEIVVEPITISPLAALEGE